MASPNPKPQSPFGTFAVSQGGEVGGLFPPNGTTAGRVPYLRYSLQHTEMCANGTAQPGCVLEFVGRR